MSTNFDSKMEAYCLKYPSIVHFKSKKDPNSMLDDVHYIMNKKVQESSSVRDKWLLDNKSK